MTEPAAMNTGLLLYIPYRAMENRVSAAIAAAGFDDVTMAQARLFRRIGLAGSRLTELAAQAQVTKQTAGFLVDQLERAGYVKRAPDPSDARARLATVTDHGQAAIAAASGAVAQVEDEWRAQLGTKAYESMRSALERLRELTDPYQ